MSNLKATIRENLSSGSNNKLRAAGMIPAILYGGKDPNKNISVEKKEISNIINSETFLSKVL
jgi:Ribosomal protein L25 (general stress protein Ctc)